MPDKAPLGRPLGQPKRRRLDLSAAQRGYDSRHRRIRAAEKAAHPLCQYGFGGVGSNNPCTGWTEEMDHKDGNTFNTDPDNLVLCCAACHRLKTFESRRRYGHG